MVQATDAFEQPVEEPPLLGRFRDAGLRERPHVRVRGEASNEPAHSGWFA
jgi:hypothetical protein